LTDISLLFDRSETDEKGIRLRAEQNDIELSFLPFHKIVIGIKNGTLIYKSKGRDLIDLLDDTKVVLNRTQGKHRRIFAASFLEAYGKKVLNPLQLEQFCSSKIYTLLAFWRNSVNIPDTLYIPCNVHEKIIRGGEQDNIEFISEMVTRELGNNLIIKSDAGTHGKGIYLAKDDQALIKSLNKVKPSIINPTGVVAQKLVNKWFYDLRIVVEKRNHGSPFCHTTAMARGGFKDFRTNTFLGNKVFQIDLPDIVMKEAIKCGNAIGTNLPAWVIALDAMPQFDEPVDGVKKQLLPHYDKLEPYFKNVHKAKSRRHQDFCKYSEEVEKAYMEYMASEPYSVIQSFITESLFEAKDNIVFHEANACPDFWEQTRIVGGIDIAISLLSCAQSLIN
jgi:glutathione synthase/RimK-type ligase-like ATP-grasp enzyme